LRKSQTKKTAWISQGPVDKGISPKKREREREREKSYLGIHIQEKLFFVISSNTQLWVFLTIAILRGA
jgi:hypothetical protein